MNQTISVYSGKSVNFVEPNVQDISIEDIGKSLSKKCRWNGHCIKFYSVAEHSVYVAKMAKKIMEEFDIEDPNGAIHKKAFIHDFSEAYISDIHTLLKQMLPAYQHIEMKTTYNIDMAFSIQLTPHTEWVVKAADNVMLQQEGNVLLKGEINKLLLSRIPAKVREKGFVYKPEYQMIPYEEYNHNKAYNFFMSYYMDNFHEK